MISVTLHNNHHTSKGIRDTKAFSINIPNTRLLAKTDYVGMTSGLTVDKSEVFEFFEGHITGCPIIRETPLNLECRLIKEIELGGESVLFIGEIVESYSARKYLKRGIPYVPKLRPILFSINTNSYYRVGRKLGKAWHEGLRIKEKVRKLS